MTLLQAYEERRLELRLKKQDVAARAGVTPTHLRRALIGKVTISPDLAAALEHALEWPRGYIATHFKPPTNEHSPPAEGTPAEREELIRELEDLRARAQRVRERIAELDQHDDESASA